MISPFFRPTKLPAYPGSPTPMSASGAPVWTSPPASAQTAGSTLLRPPSLEAGAARLVIGSQLRTVVVATRRAPTP